MFLFSYLLVSCLLSPCNVATQWRGFYYVLFFLLCVLYWKNDTKIHFFVPKICTYQKKAVPLQRK